MARQTIQNSNASLYMGGSGSVAVASNASTLPIGDASNRVYSWGMVYKMVPNGFTTVIFAKPNAKYPFQLRMEASGKLRAAIYDGTNSAVSQDTKTTADNSWHTAVGVRGADNTLKLYVDGVLIQSVSTASIGLANEASTINAGGNSYKGNISNVFVTLNELTATDVAKYHQSGTFSYPNLVQWNLSEGAGTVAYDTSGNGNNGTITSGTWTRDTPTKTRKAVGGNLVYNGDFEIVPPAATNVATTSGDKWIDGTASGANMNGDRIFGWALWNYGGTYSAKIDTSVSRSGSASMKLSTGATASTVGTRVAISSYTNFKRMMIEVLPNTSYTMSGWVKTSVTSGSATTGCRLQFVQSTGTSDVLTTTLVTGIVTTQDWTQYTTTITTGATTRFMTPVLQIVGNDGTGTLIMDAWFDDIELRPTTATTRTVAGARTAAGTRTAVT